MSCSWCFDSVRLWEKVDTGCIGVHPVYFCVCCHIFVWVYTVANFEDVQLHRQLLRPASVLQLLGHHRHIDLLSSQPRCRHLGESQRCGCDLPVRRCSKTNCFVCQSSCRVSRNTLNGYFLAGRDMAWWPVSVCVTIKGQKFKACWATFEFLGSFYFLFFNSFS